MPQLNFASSTANASLGNVQQPRRRLVRVRARDGLSSGAKCNPVTEGARYSFSPSRLCPLETEQKAGVRNGKPDFSLRNQCCRRGCTSRRNPPGAVWLRRHLQYCVEPLLAEPWILDVDTTIKPLYGHEARGGPGLQSQEAGTSEPLLSHLFDGFDASGPRCRCRSWRRACVPTQRAESVGAP